MKLSTAFLALCVAAVFPLTAPANLLLNGDFETTVSGTVLGSNHPITVPNWIVTDPTTYAAATTTVPANKPALANLVVGTATGTQGGGGPTVTLPSYQYDGSTTHNQSFDGVGAPVVLFQSFQLTAASPLYISTVFGGRDYYSPVTAAAPTSNWTLINVDATGVPITGIDAISISGTPTSTPFGSWTADTTAMTPSVAAGYYRLAISLDNHYEVDAAFISPVPEPSTCILLGAGLLVGGLKLRGIARRR